LLGLAQVAATALVALAAGARVDSIDLPTVRGTVVVWAVAWFLLGYGLFATVYGTLGSLASRTEDASSVAGPVTIVLVLAFMVSFATIGSADTTWARLVSWFPLTAPLAMPNRIAMGAATWWDPVLAVVLTLAAIAGLVVLDGRVYTRAILHTGATLTLGDAWRGGVPSHRAVMIGQAPTTATSDATATIAKNTNGPRTQAVLIVLAVALCGAVFAFAKDFVVGLAVGAAFYALAFRVTQAWRHADAEEPRRPPRIRTPVS
jgi:ABC-2 family transporter protein